MNKNELKGIKEMNERINKNSELNLEFDYTTMFRRAKVLMWLYLFTVLILKLIGFDVIEPVNIDLPIIDFINNNSTTRIVVKSLINVFTANLIYAYLIDGYFKGKIIVGKLNVRIIVIINIATIIFSLASNLILEFGKIGIEAMILSSAIYFIPILFKSKFKNCMYIFFVDLFFQLISVAVKETGFYMNGLTFYHSKDVMVSFVLTLDYYILWVIYLLDKNEKIKRSGENLCYLELDFYYLRIFIKSFWKTLNIIPSLLRMMRLQLSRKTTLRKGLRIAKRDLNKSKRCVLPWLKFSLWRVLKNKILPFIIFTTVYFGYAFLSDKVLESVFLLISYGTFRVLIPVKRQFHADYIPNIKRKHTIPCCILLSCLVLCSFLHNTATSDISILSSIAVAFILDWLLYVITVYFQEYFKSKNEKC